MGRLAEKNKILMNVSKSESCLCTRNATEKGMMMGMKMLEKAVPTDIGALFEGDY